MVIVTGSTYLIAVFELKFKYEREACFKCPRNQNGSYNQKLSNTIRFREGATVLNCVLL